MFEELLPDWAAIRLPLSRAVPRFAGRRNLRVPILLLHGREDRRVPVSQAERLADALPMLAKQTPNDQVRKRPEHAQLPEAGNRRR